MIGKVRRDALAGQRFRQTHRNGAELQTADGLGVVAAEQGSIEQIVAAREVHIAFSPGAGLGGGLLRERKGAGLQLTYYPGVAAFGKEGHLVALAETQGHQTCSYPVGLLPPPGQKERMIHQEKP